MKEINDILSSVLNEFEAEKGIKILFAVESGSRSWGMESENSDYDVRFVYARPKEDYLKIFKKEDNMNFTKIIEVDSKEVCFDFVGFDIYKFMFLLSKSNPTCIEWLMSEIIYCGTIDNDLLRYILKNFNGLALFYHYRNLTTNNYYKYIHNDREVNYKKYLYCIRGIVNALYVKNNKLVPPINLLNAVESIRIPKNIKNLTYQLIELKKNNKDLTDNPRIAELDEYIEKFITFEVSMIPDTVEKDFDYLDKKVLKYIEWEHE